MGDIRKIKRKVAGKQTVDGAGVKLVRVIGREDTKDFDPFLMLDAFDSVNPDDYIKGFPWHPHRGIETITYLIQGDIEHGDSLGNKGSILDGECQWMTAGSGIIHQEMPKISDRMLGVQLWLNLPAKDKMTRPKYHGITKADIPVIDLGTKRYACFLVLMAGFPGQWRGSDVKLLYLDVEAGPGAEWSLKANREETLFVYVVLGEGVFGPAEGEFTSAKNALLFDAGEEFRARASSNGVRFLLLAAKPLGEPIAWGGPIVMNTREELELAFKELNENRFIKP
jgi:Pirin-related protein